MAAALFLPLVACAALVLPGAAPGADSGAPLQLERTIPLAHVGGRIDHMAVDLGRKRLFIAELGNDTVDVVDLASGRLVHRFGGLREPQGVGYAPGLDLIIVANGDDGTVHLYGGGDFSDRGVVHLGHDADNVRIDPRSGEALVGYGQGGLAVIDPARGATLRRIALPGHPESFQIDTRAGRAYVNVPDARQIAVVDLAAGRQVATWTVPTLGDNFPMAIDDKGAAIAIVFRTPPRLVLLEAATGAVGGIYPTCADADDVFFDAKRARIYVSCGEGFIDVFDTRDSEYRRLAHIPTVPGARTAYFEPSTGRFFLAVRATSAEPAAIWVFRAGP